MRFKRSRLSQWGFLLSAVAIGVLAGCAARSTLSPLPASFGAADTLERLGAGEPGAAAPRKCQGQKNTKEYAEVEKETLKAKGGSLCVPAFAGWGGALQYPQTYGTAANTVRLISSTTAYKGGTFPPGGSKKPIFYLQLGFDNFPGFYPTLPKGAPIVSSHLTAKKSYTVELFEYFYALGWSKEGECYQVAAKSKHGGSLADAGALFERFTFDEHNGVIEIFDGALVTNRC